MLLMRRTMVLCTHAFFRLLLLLQPRLNGEDIVFDTLPERFRITCCQYFKNLPSINEMMLQRIVVSPNYFTFCLLYNILLRFYDHREPHFCKMESWLSVSKWWPLSMRANWLKGGALFPPLIINQGAKGGGFEWCGWDDFWSVLKSCHFVFMTVTVVFIIIKIKGCYYKCHVLTFILNDVVGTTFDLFGRVVILSSWSSLRWLISSSKSKVVTTNVMLSPVLYPARD